MIYFEGISEMGILQDKVQVKLAGILRSGENAYNWNKNLSLEERIVKRDYAEYHDFVKRVMERDGYACKICGKKDSGLAVHHLNGYNWSVAERTNDSNGVTLCDECHNAFHSVYGKGSNTKEQFEEWIGELIGDLGTGNLPKARQVICMDDGEIVDGAPATARKYNLDRNSLYNVLNRKYRAIHGKHFLWYDDYLEMTKEDVTMYWRWVMEKQ